MTEKLIDKRGRKRGGKDLIQEAAFRREKIKEIKNYHGGWKSVPELQKKLKEIYNIEVSRQTLYMDRKNITGLTIEELEEADVIITAYFQKLINNLDKIIKKSPNDKTRINAIKTAAYITDKQHDRAVRMAGFEAFKKSHEPEKMAKKKKESVSISFVDQDAEDKND